MILPSGGRIEQDTDVEVAVGPGAFLCAAAKEKREPHVFLLSKRVAESVDERAAVLSHPCHGSPAATPSQGDVNTALLLMLF